MKLKKDELVFLTIAGIIMSLVFAYLILRAYSHYNLCRTHYKELSGLDCLVLEPQIILRENE